MASVLICGGGPAGLAAALVFNDLGWDRVTVVERRQSPSDFEKNKAFNYQLDPRGQRLLKTLGLEDKFAEYGVPNDSFTLSLITPDGAAKTFTSPLIHPERGTCYWMRREMLQRMLHEAIVSRGDGRIDLRYRHRFADFVENAAGSTVARVTDPDGHDHIVDADLVLACDGLSSQVIEALAQRSEHDADYFERILYPSPSTGLTYKVLNLPPEFDTKSSIGRITDRQRAYALTSRATERTKAMALFAFPVAQSSEPRSVNIIRDPDHEFWSLKSGEAVLDFLTENFPQLDIPNLVPIEEARDCAALEPGAFPPPQYTKHLQTRLGSNRLPVVLIGDAAHAFPPDLGMGVNSAFEDLEVFASALREHGNDLGAAAAHYESIRLPQSAALARLVQRVHPYQYNQVPWRLKLWTVGFLIQRGLNRALPGQFEKPGFMMSQEHWRDFVDIETRIRRTKRQLAILWAGLAGLVTLGVYPLLA